MRADRLVARARTASILLGALGVGVAAAAGTPARWDWREVAEERRPDADERARALRFVELTAFAALRPEDRMRVTAAGLAPEAPCPDPEAAARLAALPKLGDGEYALVRRIVSRDVFDRMMPIHQRALVGIVEQRLAGEMPPAMCFTPSTEPAVVNAFNAAVYGPIGLRFQQRPRWTRTASSPGPLGQGDGVVITYSFVPDGTTTPTLDDGVTRPSNLFAFLNGIYGSPAAWQAVYAQVFTRWSQLCGARYVLEPNDDGSPIGSANGGVLGVRGDIRMSGTALDGNSNVLAFNYFPQVGDMVIDTSDSYYTNITTSSLRLRNVLAHEHGHGLGMAHVCPVQRTKLMEPYISTTFDGPQFDDILNGQRHYGDAHEPNDSVATASALGAATASAATLRTVSLDSATDVDVYALSVAAPGLLAISVRPIGSPYLQGAQTTECDTGASYSPRDAQDLAVRLIGTDGVATLASLDATPAGQAETLQAIVTAPGTYRVRVSGGTRDAIQAYELDYRLAPPPVVLVTFPDPLPTMVSPVEPTALAVRVQTLGDTVVDGSLALNYRLSASEAFRFTPLTHTGGEMYAATLPPGVCGETALFYVSGRGTLSGAVRTPAANAAASVGETTTVLADDFEVDRGWTAGAPSDTAVSGRWVRVDPIGTGAQPEDDASTVGSRCYVTGQGASGGAQGDADVDGGFTTLLTPVLDVAGRAETRVSYWRWYSNNAGLAPNADTFFVDISNDGGVTWTNVETVGPSGPGTAGGWMFHEFRVSDLVAPTSSVVVRFVASDTGDGSLVEAAVDDFTVRFTSCDVAPPVCLADFNDSGLVSLDDLFAYLRAYFAQDERANVDGLPGHDLADLFTFLGLYFEGC